MQQAALRPALSPRNSHLLTRISPAPSLPRMSFLSVKRQPLGRAETVTEGWGDVSASEWGRLRYLALVERGHVRDARWTLASRDLDPTRLQRLRHLALQFDGEQAVL